jgi:hypothetical protein
LVILNLDEFLQLISDPVKYFDETLLNNLDMQVLGNRAKPYPARIAELFSIDRKFWIDMVNGMKVNSDCVPCQKVRIKRGQRVISQSEFSQYYEFLNFENGKFTVDDSAVNTKCQELRFFARTPLQIEMTKHFQELVKILNEHYRLQLIVPMDLQLKGEKLKLKFSYATNEL